MGFKLFTSIFGSGSHGLITVRGVNWIKPISAGMFVYNHAVPTSASVYNAYICTPTYTAALCVYEHWPPHCYSVCTYMLSILVRNYYDVLIVIL